MRHLLVLLISAAFAVASATASSTGTDNVKSRSLKESKTEVATVYNALPAPQQVKKDQRFLQSQVASADEERIYFSVRNMESYVKSFLRWVKQTFKYMFGLETPNSRNRYNFRQALASTKRAFRRGWHRLGPLIGYKTSKLKHRVEESASHATHKAGEKIQKGKHRVQEAGLAAVHSTEEAAEKTSHKISRFFQQAWHAIKYGRLKPSDELLIEAAIP